MFKLNAVRPKLKRYMRQLNRGEGELATMKAIISLSGLALGIYFRDAVSALSPRLDRPLIEILLNFIGVSLVLLPILSVLLLVSLLQRTKRR